jgi:Family of unknown function (DUF6011)
MSEQNVMVETARRAKSALRKAFPGTKFSVQTRGSICVEWADDGPSPTVEQVQDVVLTIGGVEVRLGSNNERWLRVSNGRGSFYFARYNVAERTAQAEKRERWQREHQQTREAIGAVCRAKWEQVSAIERSVEPLVQLQRLPEEPAVFEAFKALRQRAETDVAFDPERSRRPSWGAPMVLEGELLEACATLGYLAPDAKPIARLWATFADPKRSRSVLRERISSQPLSGIACRGFELYAGSDRGDRSNILFEAQRAEGGAWQFGPYLRSSSYDSPRSQEWQRLVGEREQQRTLAARLTDTPEAARISVGIDQMSIQIAQIDAEDLAGVQAQAERHQLRRRAVELAKARVLEFAGAPGAQMQAAGRLSGHCFNCFRELTDPISLERGIGPDCLEGKVHFIKSAAVSGIHQEGYYIVFGPSPDGAPTDLSLIARIAAMPLEFVVEVLAEAGIDPKLPASSGPVAVAAQT